MTLLLLAGTGQAVEIASALSKSGVDAIASLAGATRMPRDLALPTRHGGFGGKSGFLQYIKDEGITAVLDATHPFAQSISNRTARVCAQKSMPYCQLLRAPWEPETGDDWTLLDSEADAADHIAKGATVFLATGRQTLERYDNLTGCRLICRQIDPPDRPFPFPNGEFLVGRPPFSVEAEIELFTRLGVDWLVVKNAGGEAPRSKLVAARQLGIRVAMIKRPAQPPGQKAHNVDEALAWVAGL